jgi:hypothetical protein
MVILTWLAKHIQQNKKEELKTLKEINSYWSDFDSFSRISQWVGTYSNTNLKAVQRIEEALCGLELISIKECTGSNSLRKVSLRAIAKLMGVEENAYKVSSNDLEQKVIRFARASA